MSTSAEEALSRARAIAARLSGNDTTEAPVPPPASASSTPTSKRKRWGVAPSIVAEAAQEVLPGLEAAKKAKLNTLAEASKRIWVSTSSERTEAHYFSYFQDRLPELARAIHTEEDKNSKSDSRLKIELKGRGSTNQPPLPGIPEEPMHIMITGPDHLVEQVEPKVDALIIKADEAPPEAIPQTSREDTAEKNSLALTTTGSASSGGYRPATVAQLISTNPLINQLHNSNDPLIEETVNVPNGIVGYLIGRGGETISSMQARTGCKVQIQKEHDLEPGQTHRVITLQATSQESIDQCRGMIESMVQDRIRAAGGPSSGGSSKDAKVNEALAMGHALLTAEVPDADVGLIIGKGGATIKHIQETTGASIQIPPMGNSENPSVRTVNITHPNEAGAAAAKQQIQQLLESKPSFANGGGQNSTPSGPQVTFQVLIPDKDVGLCIGRQGCVIREMQQKTGTRIQIPSHPTPGQPHRLATVTGPQEGCNQVQGMIERIINEQSSTHIMTGTPYNQNQYYQQNYTQQGAAAAGNGQYSAEWQAYYAAQAAVKEQGGGAQQHQQATAPAPATSGQQQPASDTYYEQFFRYAYYYGEDAARQYYGAWSPPPGTPNPYGVNPNGVTPAPAAAAGAAQALTPAAASPQQPAQPRDRQQQPYRDSSVRKVSNLPAWMTRGS